MIAAKCDRCGKLYETPKCIPNIRVFEYKHPYGDSRYDLCPECQKKLEEFLKGESDEHVTICDESEIDKHREKMEKFILDRTISDALTESFHKHFFKDREKGETNE